MNRERMTMMKKRIMKNEWKDVQGIDCGAVAQQVSGKDDNRQDPKCTA